jgi:hypothetical protein
MLRRYVVNEAPDVMIGIDWRRRSIARFSTGAASSDL